MPSRELLLAAALGSFGLGCVLASLLFSRAADVEQPESHSASHEDPSLQLAPLPARLERVEERLTALESERSHVSAWLPAPAAEDLASPEQRARTEQEIVQKHREELRALIDDSRLEQAWKERARELSQWTYGLDTEFQLPPGSIKDCLIRTYRPVFDCTWRWKDRPDYDPSVDPPELKERQSSFKSALDSTFPARLADRLFYAFGFDIPAALNASTFPDEQIRAGLDRRR